MVWTTSASLNPLYFEVPSALMNVAANHPPSACTGARTAFQFLAGYPPKVNSCAAQVVNAVTEGSLIVRYTTGQNFSLGASSSRRVLRTTITNTPIRVFALNIELSVGLRYALWCRASLEYRKTTDSRCGAADQCRRVTGTINIRPLTMPGSVAAACCQRWA